MTATTIPTAKAVVVVLATHYPQQSPDRGDLIPEGYRVVRCEFAEGERAMCAALTIEHSGTVGDLTHALTQWARRESQTHDYAVRVTVAPLRSL